LKKAKIEYAKGLVACRDSDTDNLFITLSARALNPQLKIVAEAREEISQSKMLKAGADKRGLTGNYRREENGFGAFKAYSRFFSGCYDKRR